MMYGMFGLGWLMMFLVIGLPILFIVLLVGGTAGLLQNQAHNASGTQYHSQAYPIAGTPSPTTPPAVRYCSHCGAGLQSDWTHCPQCGAPIQ